MSVQINRSLLNGLSLSISFRLSKLQTFLFFIYVSPRKGKMQHTFFNFTSRRSTRSGDNGEMQWKPYGIKCLQCGSIVLILSSNMPQTCRIYLHTIKESFTCQANVFDRIYSGSIYRSEDAICFLLCFCCFFVLFFLCGFAFVMFWSFRSSLREKPQMNDHSPKHVY